MGALKNLPEEGKSYHQFVLGSFSPCVELTFPFLGSSFYLVSVACSGAAYALIRRWRSQSYHIPLFSSVWCKA